MKSGEMELKEMQEYLLSQNQNLHNRYNQAKCILLCFQPRLEELSDSHELHNLYHSIVLKYNDPPLQTDITDPAKPPSQVTKEILENNYTLQMWYDSICQDIIKLGKRFNDVFLKKPGINRIQASRSWQDLDETNNQNLQDIENWEAEMEEKCILTKQHYEAEARETRALLENTELHTKVQSLLESNEDLKEQLEDRKSLQCFHENLIEELKEEYDALCQRVMLLEDSLRSESSLRECSITAESIVEDRDKTNKLLEKGELEKEIRILIRQKHETKVRAEDLNEQLKRAQQSYKIYRKLIRKYFKEAHALRETLKELDEKLQRNRSSRCKRFINFLSPKWRKYQENMAFLIRQKNETKDRAENIKEQLQNAQDIYNTCGLIIREILEEIEALDERVRMLNDQVQRIQPLLIQRICSVFCLPWDSRREEISILVKQKQQAKNRAKGLKKHLTEAQKVYCMYEVIIEELRKKENELDEKVRMLDEKLQHISTQPSLCSRAIKFFCRGRKKYQTVDASESVEQNLFLL